MPKVGCPQCSKAYQLPDTAAGKVATCKCGAKFRVKFAGTASGGGRKQPTPRPVGKPTGAPKSGSSPQATAVATSAPTAKAAPAAKGVPIASDDAELAPLGGADDGFWDSEIPDTGDPLAAAAAASESVEEVSAAPKKSRAGAKIGGAAKRLAKIIGGVVLILVWCGMVYLAYTEGGRFRVRSLWLPIAGLGLIASGIFGE